MTIRLEAVLQNSWQMLAAGASEKNTPLSIATIGTVTNNTAQLRTVVLRKTVIPERQLHFYTDIRSAKVQQLADNPILSWLFYHPIEKIQLKAISSVKIHHQDAIALENWKEIPSYGLKTYATLQAPSTPLSQPRNDLPTFWTSEKIEKTQTAYTYNNFAVVVTTIKELEWLHLQRSGNQRARFTFINGQWDGTWIVP